MTFNSGDFVFSDWQVLRKIGRGASGTVYEIRKTNQGAELSAALKVLVIPEDPGVIEALRRDGLDEQSTTNYLKAIVNELVEEIKIMIFLKDFPYVVKCEDFDLEQSEDGNQWTVMIRMELLTPVSDYRQANDLTEADVHRMAVQLTRALALLEDHNIIHRDLKPENIFVNHYGDFKIGDFGIARVYDQSNAWLSQKGTPNYMAPEVFHGHVYDHTVDIYSLGIVLYRYLNNNRLPFMPLDGAFSPNEQQAALSERLSGKPLPPPARASAAFGKIILKMCAFQPGDRYPDAKSLLKDLEALKPGQNVILPADAGAAGGSGSGPKSASGKPGSGPKSASGKPAFGASGGRREKGAAKAPAAGATPPASPTPPAPPAPPKDAGGGEKKKGGGKLIAILIAAIVLVIGLVAILLLSNDYPLTVELGSGSGRYKPGASVYVEADAIAGKAFVRWEATGVELSDAARGASAMSFEMPRRAVTLTAQFVDAEYQLSVQSGSGSGNYAYGAQVRVEADEITGKRFDHWEARGIELSDEQRAARAMSFAMPANPAMLTAKYADIEYELSVRSGSGGGSYTYGARVTVKPDPAPQGHSFVRWEVADRAIDLPDPAAQVLSFEMPDHPVALTAVYAPNVYQLTVENGEGAGSYRFGDEATVVAVQRPYETFTGWEVVEGPLTLEDGQRAAPAMSFAMPAGDVTLSARYQKVEYAVTVEHGTGGGSYAVGDRVWIKADAPVQGMRFAGWEIAEGEPELEDATRAATSFTMPDHAVAVEAGYAALSFRLEVTGADGSGMYPFDSEVTISAGPVEKHTFDHWSVERGSVDLTEAQLSQPKLTFKMPAQHLALAAVYAVSRHSVTVSGGSGSGEYAVDDTVEIAADGAAEGMAFSGWTVADGDVQLEDEAAGSTSFVMPDGDVTVEAQYAPKAYRLTVDGAEGSGTYRYGETVELTAGDRAGFTFEGWSVEQGEVALTDANAQHIAFEMPAGDLALAARYQPVLYAVEVVNGTGGGAFAAGDPVTVVAADYSDQDLTFAYWQAEPELPDADGLDLNRPELTFTMPAAPVTMTAWYARKAQQTRALTVNGGSGGGSYAVGEQVTVSADQAAEGTRFEGWTVDQGSLALLDPGAADIQFEMPDEDLVITAHYQAALHTVAVTNGTGGGAYAAGEQVTVTADDYSEQGLAFVRWEVESGDPGVGAIALTEPELTFTMPDGDVAIAAGYEVVMYPVQVVNGTGGGTFAAGAQVTVTAGDYSAQDLTFAYWQLEPGKLDAAALDLTQPELTFTMPAGPVTLTAWYARGRQETHALTVNGGSGGGSYAAGAAVTIRAEQTADGVPFAGWTVDQGSLALSDPGALSVTFEMPDEDLVITAHYRGSKHTVNVVNGTGSGMFSAGERVTVTAGDYSAQDLTFAYWEVESALLDTAALDLSQPELTFTMPDEPVTVTAWYARLKQATPTPGPVAGHLLTVNGGTGSGTYAPGEQVTISAEAPRSGMRFVSWMVSGYTGAFDDESETIVITMPDNDVVFTAFFAN